MMSIRMQSCSGGMQQGSSLLEVMIAVVIFSLALLGLSGLQMTALKSNQSALSRSIAVNQAYEILDRMRSNSVEAKSGNYDIDLGDPTPTGSGSVALDLQAWKGMIKAALPDGDASICRRADSTASACQGAGDFFVINVEWARAGTGDDPLFDADSQRVTVVGQL